MTDKIQYPRISIVTPSYNQAEFLERTIQSVLSQDYPDLEYIIMDGGSTDGSVEIIRKYEDRIACWTSGRDGGQADAIGKGFARATGEILAWLNSDDTYLPGALLAAAEAFTRNPKAGVVFGNVNFIDRDDRKTGDLRFTRFDRDTLLYEGGNISQPGAFWRRDLYEAAGGINPDYAFCMDYDLFCRMSERAGFLHIRRPLSNFRVHGSAKSTVIAETGNEEHRSIAKRYLKDEGSLGAAFRLRVCQLRRLFLYLLQGDADYAIKGLFKRLGRA